MYDNRGKEAESERGKLSCRTIADNFSDAVECAFACARVVERTVRHTSMSNLIRDRGERKNESMKES